METTRGYSGAVAAEIRATISRLGMSQDQLAAGTGITKATLSRSLSGARALDLDELAAICAAVGLAPSELVTRAEVYAA
jgi:transcriptional regulator with XRE-family HTH domain